MLPQVSAQIRPNNLGRRTSYRTYQKVPIPVMNVLIMNYKI
jgi:hypothetical protein